MKKTNQVFLNLYLVDAIVHVFSIAEENVFLENISKVALMILLMGHVILNYRTQIRMAVPILAALFFSWLGDVLLIFTLRPNGATYFMLGLGAFLIAHIAWVMAFSKFSDHSIPGRLKQKPFLSVPFILYALILLYFIYPSLDNLLIPVILYALVITLMAMAALNRQGRTNAYSFGFVFYGALLFIVSDSLIALNKFYTPVPNASIFIMVTYVAAQYLLVSGCMLHHSETVQA